MSDTMTIRDTSTMALVAWRENRGGGTTGMQSVMNVIMNRATLHHSSPYDECVRKWQFSSLTAKGDPQLEKGPNFLETSEWELWLAALGMAQDASMGLLADVTEGATSYYALSMPEPPRWAKEMVKTVEIEGQVFYREA